MVRHFGHRFGKLTSGLHTATHHATLKQHAMQATHKRYSRGNGSTDGSTDGGMDLQMGGRAFISSWPRERILKTNLHIHE